jgi:hypothetical protein
MAKENLQKFFANVIEKDQKLRQRLRAKVDDMQGWGEWVSAEGAKHGFDFTAEEALEVVFGPRELGTDQLAQATGGAKGGPSPVGRFGGLRPIIPSNLGGGGSGVPGAEAATKPGGGCRWAEYGDCCNDV